ncbi:hypothetical protein [Peribacillus butanolivorans]|uniref:hypothetical protein n=1 Tax=Peribacillus butanolivorans TaxID=421767 RepID=UPI0006A6FF56|nr:hypothetical protein [Peribacillus butanolivorans]
MKKRVLSIMLIGTLVFSIVPSTFASEITTENEEVTTVTEQEVQNTGIIVGAIEELDEKLDMENLPSNTQEEIDLLSSDARELYNFILDYSNNSSKPLTSDDTLVVLGAYLNKLNNSSVQNNSEQITPFALGSVKEYKISNAKVKDLNAAVGANTGFWTLSAAIAKIWAKNPTVLTAMLVAIPIVGMSALNVCNRKGKGVIIKKISIGTAHQYSCTSQ